MRGGARWVRWSPQLTSMRGVLLSYVCSHHLHVTEGHAAMHPTQLA